MPRIFKERGINVNSVLGINEFVLHSDAKVKDFVPEKLDSILKKRRAFLKLRYRFFRYRYSLNSGITETAQIIRIYISDVVRWR